MSWGTQPGSGQRVEYARTNFYIHSTNKHNHAHTVRTLPEHTRFPPEVVAQMREMVDDPLTPYRSLQDLIRDAVYHRLHDLAEMRQDGDFPPRFQTELLRQAIAHRHHEQEEFAETVEMIDKEVETAFPDADSIADLVATAKESFVPRRFHRRWTEAIARWEQRLDEASKINR